MGNAPSSRPWLFRRTRLQAITAIGGVVAILVVAGTLTLAALNLHNVKASGAGGGGDCSSTTGPVCTFSGHSGTASFASNSDCVTTDIWVFATEGFARSGATSGESTYAYVSTNSYNSCTGANSWGSGYDFNGAIQWSQATSTLAVQGNVNVNTYNSDGTTSTTPYTINLTWQGYGKPTRQMDSFHTESPTYLSQGHIDGTSQIAYASGTLSDGTTNFAASGTTSSEMMFANSGTFVTIQK